MNLIYKKFKEVNDLFTGSGNIELKRLSISYEKYREAISKTENSFRDLIKIFEPVDSEVIDKFIEIRNKLQILDKDDDTVSEYEELVEFFDSEITLEDEDKIVKLLEELVNKVHHIIKYISYYRYTFNKTFILKTYPLRVNLS